MKPQLKGLRSHTFRKPQYWRVHMLYPIQFLHRLMRVWPTSSLLYSWENQDRNATQSSLMSTSTARLGTQDFWDSHSSKRPMDTVYHLAFHLCNCVWIQYIIPALCCLFNCVWIQCITPPYTTGVNVWTVPPSLWLDLQRWYQAKQTHEILTFPSFSSSQTQDSQMRGKAASGLQLTSTEKTAACRAEVSSYPWRHELSYSGLPSQLCFCSLGKAFSCLPETNWGNELHSQGF